MIGGVWLLLPLAHPSSVQSKLAGAPDEFLAQFLRIHPVRLIILRGLPGSGKSTLANVLARAHHFVHLEADQHFTRDGFYQFNPANASDAHAVCQKQTLDILRADHGVVVANTHVRLWELTPYVGIAHLLGLQWAVIECQGSWPNIHGVPDDVVRTMREKFEPMPAEFASQVVVWP